MSVYHGLGIVIGFILLILIGGVIIFSGSVLNDENSTDIKPPADTTEIKGPSTMPQNKIYTYTDVNTGVEYLIFDYGYSGGMTPRYNADGTLRINAEFAGGVE